jgi:hypothetical protein
MYRNIGIFLEIFFFQLFPFIGEYLTEIFFEQKACQIAKICHTQKKKTYELRINQIPEVISGEHAPDVNQWWGTTFMLWHALVEPIGHNAFLLETGPFHSTCPSPKTKTKTTKKKNSFCLSWFSLFHKNNDGWMWGQWSHFHLATVNQPP